MKAQRIAFTILIIFVLVLAVTCFQGPIFAEQTNLQTDNNVSFIWAFGAIKKGNQELKFTAEAERPIASTGSIRAHTAIEETEFPALDKLAIEFTVKDFFAKTFTIDHK